MISAIAWGGEASFSRSCGRRLLCVEGREAGGGGGLRLGGAVSGDAAPDGRAFYALLLTDELCRMNKL